MPLPDEATGEGIPPDSIDSVVDVPPLGDTADEVVASGVDCDALYRTLQTSIRDAVMGCINECEVGVTSCVRCVAGTIESAFPSLAASLNKCYSRLASVVSAEMDYVRSIGLSLGMGPVASGDMGTGSVGDVIGLPVNGGSTGTVGGGTLSPPPGGSSGQRPPGPPDINAPISAGECIPNTWTPREVLIWLAAVYGDGVILAYPGVGIDGIYATTRGGTYRIPSICPATSNVGNVGGTGPSVPTIPSAPIAGGSSPGQTPTPILPPLQTQPPEGTPRPISPPYAPGPIPPDGPCPTVDCGNYSIPPEVATQVATLSQTYPGIVAVPYNCQGPVGWSEAPGTAGHIADLNGCLFTTYIPPLTEPTKPPPPVSIPTAPPPGGLVCSPTGMQSKADGYAAFAQSTTGSGQSVLNAIGGLAGIVVAGGVAKLTGADAVPGLSQIFTGIGVVGGMAAGDVVRDILLPDTKENLCNSDAFIQQMARRATAGLFGGWFGAVPPPTIIANDYNVNYYCPNRIPDQGELNALFSRGLIVDINWETPTRMLGNCPEWQRLIVEASQVYPSIAESIAARRRGIITDDELEDLYRRNGLVSDDFKRAFYTLTEFVPGPNDIVTFMVRDVFDSAVVEKYKLDDEFTSKFTGDALQWAKSQGMSDDVFKYYWRAHWQIPSITQLSEMVYRLRPNNRSANDQFKNVVVTLDDVRQAIKVNDMAPTWVEPLIATSYRVTTRVDLRRQYEIGAIELDDVERGYLDLGYTPEAAKAQTKFTLLDSGPKRAKRSGYASTADILKWYASAAINRDEAEFLLRQAGLTSGQASTTLETADLRLTALNRSNAVKAYRKRYMSGEFADSEIVKPLTDAGLDQDKIAILVASWRIERDAKYKGPTAAMLCNWYSRGLLSIEEFERRIGNMGYSHVDAVRIIQTCIIGDTQRKQKEAQALQAKLEQKQRQANAEAKANQKALEAARKALLPCRPPPKPVCSNGVAT